MLHVADAIIVYPMALLKVRFLIIRYEVTQKKHSDIVYDMHPPLRIGQSKLPATMLTMLLPCVVFYTTLLLKISKSLGDNTIPTVTVALMLENENSSITDLTHFKPSFDIAIEELHASVTHNFYINFTVRETGAGCGKNGLAASAIAAQMLQNDSLNIDAFFGPLCYTETAAVADLAAYWNVPIFSALDTNPVLLNKHRFKTLVRMSHSRGEEAEFVDRIFQQFNWRHSCVLLWDNKHQEFTDLAETLREDMMKYDIGFERVVISDYGDNIQGALLECTKSARVMVFAFEGQHIRKVLLSAYDANLANGQYAFIAISTSRSGPILQDENWKQDDDRDSDAKTAYESLLWIRLYEPENTQFKDFLRNVQLKSYQSSYLSGEHETQQIEYSLAAFHDAVILYAYAINRTIADGGDIRDGMAVLEKLRNQDFYLNYGVFDHLTIKEDLDREADYSLWDMTQTNCGEFTVVANFRGLTRNLTQTGEFVWPAGQAGPPDSLPFSEAGLSTLSIYAVAIGVTAFTCLVFVGLLALFFRYKKMIAEVEAQKTAWKIRWDDLTFSSTRSLAKSYATMSLSESTPYLQSTSRLSDNKSSYQSINQVAGEFRDTACSIALYENRQVVVKRLNKLKVQLSASVNRELKANRLAEHENVARFFGACVEEPTVAVVHQYCPRGSLRDFVQSGTVEADVKDILMIDIAKGLDYLHNSPVGYHGKLHWNNCVIDSRFVVQLTDYGLYDFKLGEEEDQSNPMYMERRLWLAPEHLRNKSLRPSQKADIYAMGLLLQVIITSSRPYDHPDVFYTAEQIIEKVKFNTVTYFRPVVPETLCRDTIRNCMQRCWAENPVERPTTVDVLKSVKKGRKAQNIVDQLLNRMEKYANKLEALVEERTEAFLEEKKKAEELLYEVLPRTVAKQLMQGTFVDPETFSSVTICFTDVVQFTEMSSRSTPMQVIGLLNNLYTTFDEILTGYDVYKVETIGDAYMVASGLPIRNGTLHAREIACVALALSDAVNNIKGIGHRCEEAVQLRVGIHTGSCVAGVVGHKMPRYCLFGDTVNTASRMESTSQAQRIHMSQQTKEVLDTFTIFDTELRGEMEIKGKGKQTTYWLLGQRGIMKSMTPTPSIKRSTTPRPSSTRIQTPPSRKQSHTSNHTSSVDHSSIAAINAVNSQRNSLVHHQAAGMNNVPVIET